MKTILITGSTDGIGKQTALMLSQSGHSIVLHGRNAQRCITTMNEIKFRVPNAVVDYVIADLSSMNEVQKMAQEIRTRFPQLNVLLHNAGVFMTTRQLTIDGLEMTFAVNHLAPFLLTNELKDVLVKNAPSRIITVSSIAHQRGRFELDNLQAEKRFDGYGAYALSKLCNVLFTYELSEQLANTGVTANCLHPGVVGTKLLRTGFNMDGNDTLEQGAETSVYLAENSDVENITGKYFVKKQIQLSSMVSRDVAIRKALWLKSEEILQKVLLRR